MTNTNLKFQNISLSYTITITLFLILTSLPSILFAANYADEFKQHGYYFELLTFKSGLENNTQLEIYSEIPLQNLNFVKTSNGYFAKYTLSVKLINHSIEFVHRTAYTDSVRIQSEDMIPIIKLHVIKFAFIIPAGDYQAIFQLKDIGAFKNIKFIKNVTVPDFDMPGLKLSDLQLSSSIARSEDHSELVKNNWKIIPNVSHIFGMGANTLYVYCEMYNLNQDLSEIDQGIISTFTIKNSEGEEVKSLNLDNLKFGKNSVLIGKIPIQDLETGQYKLFLNVTDLGSGQNIEKSTSFNVINPRLVMKRI